MYPRDQLFVTKTNSSNWISFKFFRTTTIVCNKKLWNVLYCFASFNIEKPSKLIATFLKKMYVLPTSIKNNKKIVCWSLHNVLFGKIVKLCSFNENFLFKTSKFETKIFSKVLILITEISLIHNRFLIDILDLVQCKKKFFYRL